MNKLLLFVLFMAVGVFFVCCKSVQPTVEDNVQVTTTVGEEPDVATAPLPDAVIVATAKLSWETNHPERSRWSAALLNFINQDYFTQFDSAKDAIRFCPKYKALSRAQRVQMWAELIVKTTYFESGFNPKEHYREPPPLGYDSIGLLQLSYEDTGYGCALNRAAKSLEDPISNLACGTRIMAKLIGKAAMVTAPHNKGAAAYWSTLREGHKVNQIAAHTKSLGFCN